MGEGIGSTKWGNSLVFRGILLIFTGSFTIISTINILMGGSISIFDDSELIIIFINIFGIVVNFMLSIIILVQVANEKKRLQNIEFTKFTKLFAIATSIELAYYGLMYLLPRLIGGFYGIFYPEWNSHTISVVINVVLLFFFMASPILFVFAWKQFQKYANNQEPSKIVSAGKSIRIRYLISAIALIPSIIFGIILNSYEIRDFPFNPYSVDYPISAGNYIHYITNLIFLVLSMIFYAFGDIQFGIQIAQTKFSAPLSKQQVRINPPKTIQNHSEIINTSDTIRKTIICERCGTKLPKEARFCIECGSDIL